MPKTFTFSNKSTTPTVSAPDSSKPTFDKAKCLEHLSAVEKEMLKYAGKVGFNPYLWITHNISPLRVRLNNNESTLELQTSVMELKAVEPKIQVCWLVYKTSR